MYLESRSWTELFTSSSTVAVLLTFAIVKIIAFMCSKLEVKSSVQSKDTIELLLASKHLNYHKCSIKPGINLEKRLFFNTCALINTLWNHKLVLRKLVFLPYKLIPYVKSSSFMLWSFCHVFPDRYYTSLWLEPSWGFLSSNSSLSLSSTQLIEFGQLMSWDELRVEINYVKNGSKFHEKFLVLVSETRIGVIIHQKMCKNSRFLKFLSILIKFWK